MPFGNFSRNKTFSGAFKSASGPGAWERVFVLSFTIVILAVLYPANDVDSDSRDAAFCFRLRLSLRDDASAVMSSTCSALHEPNP